MLFMVLLKLTLAPVLIGLVSLAERRWGAAISGALVGLPLTSGPVLFFVAVEQGASFSAHMAIGSLLGLTALAAFALAYSLVARARGWLLSMGLAILAYVAVSAVIIEVPLRRAVLSFAVTCAGLSAVLCAFPRTPPSTTGVKSVTGGELIWRMITAGLLVFLLTAVAPILGPIASALITMSPVYISILTVFNHLKSGMRAITVLKGALTGAFGGAVFFVIVAAALERLAIGVCFGMAALAAVAVQAVLVPYLRLVPARDRPARRNHDLPYR
jgi:hypothetical protein